MWHCFSSALPLVPWGRRIPLETCFKIVVFVFWRRDPVLELQFLMLLRVVLLRFATQALQ
jgi:hypothetical protein